MGGTFTLYYTADNNTTPTLDATKYFDKVIDEFSEKLSFATITNSDYKEYGDNNSTTQKLLLESDEPIEDLDESEITKSTVEDDEEIFILGSVGGIEIPFLIDTGAKYTVIDQHVFSQIPPTKYKTIPLLPHEASYSINGQIIEHVAKLLIHLRIGDTEKSVGDDCIIIVAKDLKIPGLLGRNHIYKFIRNIDFQDFSLILYEENWIVIPVYLTQAVTLPPGGIAFLDITADISNMIPNISYLQFENKPKFNKQFWPIIIPYFKIIFTRETWHCNEINMRIVAHNPSTISYNLQKGTMVGTFVGITEELAAEKRELVLSPEETPIIVEEDNKPMDIDQETILTNLENTPNRITHDIFYLENQISQNYFGEFIDYANADVVNIRDADEPSNIKMIDINPKLESYQLAELDSVLKEFQSVFNSDQHFPPPADAPAMRIDTGDNPPIKQQNYRVNKLLWEHVPAKIDQYLKNGILRHSNSPWCNPLNPVLKPNPQDPVRICLDFRKLNDITKKDSFPLPNIQDILESLRTPKFFALIDLAAGYHQIPIHEDDKLKTAFIANGLLLEWNYLIEGLTNAPAWFQRYMALYVLKGLIGDACYAYIDDIIVYGDTWEEFINNLRKVLDRLSKHRVSAKASKTKIGYNEIKLLGHIVGNGKIKPNPELVRSITEFPNPQTVKQLQRFLGLANYYRKFIDKFSYIAQPLYELLKKQYQRVENFSTIWGDRQETSMRLLKKLLSSEPILKCPDHQRLFQLTTDACKLGIAGILSQPHEDGEHPVAYISRTLDKYEQKYAAVELECLAIVWSVEQFRSYLGSSKFLIYTDHKPLAWLKTSISKNARLHRWATSLSQYNFEIKHKPGKELVHVDCLSRAIESIENTHETLKESMNEFKDKIITTPQYNQSNTLIAHIRTVTTAEGKQQWNTRLPPFHLKDQNCNCIIEHEQNHFLSCHKCGELIPCAIIYPADINKLKDNNSVKNKPLVVILTPKQLFRLESYSNPLFSKYLKQNSSTKPRINQTKPTISKPRKLDSNRILNYIHTPKTIPTTITLKSALFAFGSKTRKRKHKRVHFADEISEVQEDTSENKEVKVEEDEEPTYEVKKIIDKQISPLTNRIKYLVKWKNYEPKYNSWESLDNLQDVQWAIDQYEIEKEQQLLNELKEQKETERKIQQNIPIRLNQDYLLTGELSSLIEDITKAQWTDNELLPILKYLKEKLLPANNPDLQIKIRKQSQDFLLDPNTNTLYRIKRDNASLSDKNQYDLLKRLVIPKIYQEEIIKHQHDSPFAGHLGINKTYSKIKSYFYWNQCLRDVDNYIRTCPKCQTMKSKPNRNIPIHAMPIPSYPFEMIAVDFKGPINTSDPNKYILVFIDYFTRWAITIPTSSTTSEVIANALIEHVITKFGAPKKLLSDRGTNFLSNLMQEVYKWFSIKKLNTTAYHPEANGLVERFNQTILNILNTLCDYEKEHWSSYLAAATWAYNTSMQEALKESPYVVLYGRPPHLIGPGMDSVTLDKYETQQAYIQSMLEHFDYVNKCIRPRMEEAQLRYLKQNLKLKSIPEYYPGDQVWYFLPFPIRVKSIENPKLPEKLKSKVTGPYTIVRKISKLTYEIAWSSEKNLIYKTQVVHVLNLLPVHKRENQTDDEFKQQMENLIDYNDLTIIEDNPVINQVLDEQTQLHQREHKMEESKNINQESLHPQQSSILDEPLTIPPINHNDDVEMKFESNNIPNNNTNVNDVIIPETVVSNNDTNNLNNLNPVINNNPVINEPNTPILNNVPVSSQPPSHSIKTHSMSTRSTTKWNKPQNPLYYQSLTNDNFTQHPQYQLLKSGKFIFNPINHQFITIT